MPFRSGFFENIDEIFREMEKMMEKEFRELSKRVPESLIKEKTLPNGTKTTSWGPFVYGYSMKIGPDGKPEVSEFGNIKPGTGFGRPRIDIREKREPLADVMTANGDVKIVVELPGVEKNDIKLHATEGTLTISVDTLQHKFFKELKLPAKVDPKKASSSYKNGVLEVTLSKEKEEKPKGRPINVE